jgi:Fic family protein
MAEELTPSLVHDIQEIINYRTALSLGETYIRDNAVTLFLVRELHRVLMSSVRGQDRKPGEFRKAQNWIGRPGYAIEEATFVPPNPLQLQDHMQAWESYARQTGQDSLVQTAVLHAQFELVHPFEDGNGRIGRLLIPLFLLRRKLLSSPIFNYSEYLEANREEYYACLQGISWSRDWTGWIAFFLRGIVRQAHAQSQQVKRITSLYASMQKQFREIARSRHSALLVDALFANPVFEVSYLFGRVGADMGNSGSINIPKPTAHRLVDQLQKAGIIRQLRRGAGSRAVVYEFPALRKILEEQADAALL